MPKPAQIISPERVWDICVAVSKAVRPENWWASAQLLHMIAAHESDGFSYSRQIRAGGAQWAFEGGGGAGLWQLERISIEESLRRLKIIKNAPYAERGAQFLFGSNVPGAWWAVEKWVTISNVHQIIRFSEKLCCLFARYHLLWIPKPLPESPDQAAEYAKRWYNKPEGKADAGDYYIAWNRWTKDFTLKDAPCP